MGGHAPMSNLVQVTRVEDGVVRVHLDDVSQQNRMTDTLIVELMEALGGVALDETARVVLLTGRKDVFCGGGARELLQAVVDGNHHVKDLALPAQMLELPVPIIGVMEGHAVGAGLALGLCCDLTVASRSSRYGLNFNSLGFTPGMGVTGLVPPLAGHGFATEMMMTARFFKGHELSGHGLFTHVVPADEVMPVSVDLAHRIARKPRHVITALKAALGEERRAVLSGALAREHVMHRACFARPEVRAVIEATYIEPAPSVAR